MVIGEIYKNSKPFFCTGGILLAHDKPRNMPALEELTKKLPEELAKTASSISNRLVSGQRIIVRNIEHNLGEKYIAIEVAVSKPINALSFMDCLLRIGLFDVKYVMHDKRNPHRGRYFAGRDMEHEDYEFHIVPIPYQNVSRTPFP